MNRLKSDINKWRVSIALLLGLLGLLFPIFSSAEISNPYVIDEKETVDFGDAGYITDGDVTYHGLQNYKYEYVNDYLHITYTNTHQSCCAAGYPPRIYITNINPVGTTSIVVKHNSIPFVFLQGQPSDWYAIDIQFDPGGYRFVVKQRGQIDFFDQYYEVNNLTDTNWVSLANMYPVPNGPNDFSMAFTPIPLKKELVQPPSKNPVIIIPGIMGSELYNNNLSINNLIWPDTIKFTLYVYDEFLDILKLDPNGNTLNDIAVGDIIRNINNTDYFNGLVNVLESNGYQEGTDLFVFSYDWRLKGTENVTLLASAIEEIKVKTGAQKVDIIAHSMGGLLSKYYLINNSSIDKFIDIATPHVGSPKAFKTVMFGETIGTSHLFGLIGVNSERIKIISQNMASIYELIPSKKFVDSNNYVYDLDDIDQNNIRGKLSYDQTNDFLKNSGRNPLLIDQAKYFHNQIDNVNPINYGVDTYNIVGCGTPTLGKIFLLNKESSGDIEYNISYIQGDGTVPIDSAKSLNSNKTFYFKNAIHATMPSASGVKEIIASILNEEEIDPNDYVNITTTELDCPKVNGQVISFHSPIELNIYDDQGRHTGPLQNGDIENNVPGVQYEIIDGNKFAFLPGGSNYKVVGESIGSGSFNARIEKVENENIIETKYFNKVPLTVNTNVEVGISDGISTNISVDNNGDGIFENQVAPSSILDSAQSQDIIKPSTNVLFKGNKTNDGSYISSVQVTLIANDDNSGVLKTEYSTNSGITWIKYIEPFTINNRGGVKLIYKSTDKAGNVEVNKISNINIIYPANSGNKK